MEYDTYNELIKDDLVDDLAKILSLNEKNNFNIHLPTETPLLHVAVQRKSQRILEYLLSQDFVDKSICNEYGENIYHVICSMRGADQLFSIIEKKVPHHLLNTPHTRNAFHIACAENNIFIVKRVYEILASLKVGKIRPENHFKHLNHNEDGNKFSKKEFETMWENRMWYSACENANLDVVQFIFSLKGFQPEIIDITGKNALLFVCSFNSNIKVIKYIHKLFPSFIHSQITRYHGNIQNAALLVIKNSKLNRSDKLNILHYLYLNGIDIHLLTRSKYELLFKSIYSRIRDVEIKGFDSEIIQYLKVISQDFDYQKNEHDDEVYRKPSFWKQIDSDGDEQAKTVNEWKNRFDEHVLHHLSKMIQNWMLDQNQQFFEDDDDDDDW